MVGGRVDGRNSVEALWEAVGDFGRKDPTLCCIVEALEEGEIFGVGGRRLLQRIEFLDDDVRVAEDPASIIELLGCSIVRLVWVGKMSRCQVFDGDLDGESLVRLDCCQIGRADELGRGHVVGVGDEAHRCRVARSTRDLLPVGDRQVVSGQAEVDKVVGRCEGFGEAVVCTV